MRRLFTDRATGQLTDLDTTRRTFNGTLRRFIRIRDHLHRRRPHLHRQRRRRMPTVQPRQRDPGWTTHITTPSGKTYTSTSPPVHGTRARTPTPDTPAGAIRMKFTDLLALAS